MDSATAVQLEAAGWTERVGDDLGLWVSVARQRLYGIRRGRIEFEYVCSTAAKGVGQIDGSHQTPLGWHEIAEKHGDGLPEGAILRERKYTGEVWKAETAHSRRAVLTRILRLRGLEPGLNAGPGCDSFERFIYIHGTPAEDALGQPASGGCVCLSNHDVIELYERIPVGARILISN